MGLENVLNPRKPSTLNIDARGEQLMEIPTGLKGMGMIFLEWEGTETKILDYTLLTSSGVLTM